MESFALMKNSLIDYVDKNSKEPVLQSPYKNSLKTIVKVEASNFSNKVYGLRHSLKVPKAYSQLAQVYLKIDVNTPPFGVAEAPYIYSRFFDIINFRTESGVLIQSIEPQYTIMRIDELSETSSNFKRITDGNKTVDANGTSYYCPLFFYFSESNASFLPVKDIKEQLYIDLYGVTEPSALGITNGGAVYEFTKIVPSLYFLFFDRPDNVSVPKFLPMSYNTFYEEPISIADSVTYHRVLLRATDPLFNVTSYLVDQNQNVVKIRKMNLSIKGNTYIREFNDSINYTFFSERDAGYSSDEALTFWFSRNESRVQDSGLLTFGSDDNMFPVYLDLTFDAVDPVGDPYLGRTLYVFCEHKTHHEIVYGKITTNKWSGTLHANVS